MTSTKIHNLLTTCYVRCIKFRQRSAVGNTDSLGKLAQEPLEDGLLKGAVLGDVLHRVSVLLQPPLLTTPDVVLP